MSVPHDQQVPVPGQPAFLATDEELAAHAADTNLHGGGAVSAHVAAADPHTGYLQEASHDQAAHVALGLATGSDVPTAISAHEALADPHTGYQKESEKGQASGYASLDVSGTIPDAQIPSTIARDTEITSAVSAHVAAADPHTGYIRKIGGGAATVQSHGVMGAAKTIDLANGNSHAGTLDANCTFTFTGATASAECEFVLELTQNVTGGWTATFPASVVDGAVLAGRLNLDPDAVTIFVFRSRDGGTTWHGFVAGDSLVVEDADASPSGEARKIIFKNGTLVDGGAGVFSYTAPTSGINSGTSFPVSPTDREIFYRTDRDILYFYDLANTRWLSVQLYREQIAMLPSSLTPVSTSGIAVGRLAPWHTTYDLWCEDFWFAAGISTTNNGSNYWTFALKKYTPNLGASVTMASRNTSADTVGVTATAQVAIDALLTPGSYNFMQVEATKTGAPDVFSIAAMAMSYRLVG